MAELEGEKTVLMALAAPSAAASDHKRKHEDLEADSPESQINANSNGNSESESESESVKNAEEEEQGDDSDAKRPRLEDKTDDNGLGITATENGCHETAEEVAVQPPVDNNIHIGDAQQPAEESVEKVNDKELAVDGHQTEGIQHTSEDVTQSGNVQEALVEHPEKLQDIPADVPQQEVVSSADHQDTSEAKSVSRKMEVPNTKVGVLIGKAGDTIRYLQYNSGARIQITRDADSDPYAGTRSVELIGTLESINKAEKLIKDVITEADAGGSPSLVARGFNTVQASGAGEQIQIQVPNEKVGLIIGKGGETIKNLQTRSGARIQLIPQHLPEGDQSKERAVRVTGDKKQIEMARDMIKEVMDQTARPSPLSSGYNQQAFRSRGPAASQWGPRAPHPGQQTGYGYQQRGPYQSQNPQYPHQAYGNYPPQQVAPRSNFGWEQRPQTTTQGPPHGGYDYYGGQGGHASDASKPIHHARAPGPSPAMGPPSQANYNYGQPQGPDYGQLAPYSQNAPPAHSYGHGYIETKYDSQVAMQHPYGGHGASQPSSYPQGTAQPGYGEQYGKPPSYGMPQQGPHVQSYGQPRATQPGNMPYQGSVPTPSYGQTASAQQPYPYASSGQVQQSYPPYGSVPSADGYNQQPPAVAPAPAPAPGYPQQGGQPVSGYVQPGGQQASVYSQVGPTGGYGQYPSSQPGYTELVAPNNAAYGYQGVDDQAYSGGPVVAYGALPSGQPAYSQPAPTQPSYGQTIPQSGGYATAPASY